MKHLVPLLLVIFIFTIKVGAEPLTIYDTIRFTQPNGTIINDGVITGDVNQSLLFRKNTFNVVDPNKPQIGNTDDCYPDDPQNPKGNIVLRGRVFSKFNEKPITGAVVAVYMGMDYSENKTNMFGNDEKKFIIGDGGKLINFYSYDVTNNGYFEVYACNDFKTLADTKVKKAVDEDCVDGYVPDSSGNCRFYDYTENFPKFYLSVICGNETIEEKPRDKLNFYKIEDQVQLKPWIGEILSIDNFNDPYKINISGKNSPILGRPEFLVQDNLDLRVNCGSEITPFPVPMFLNYVATENVSSCRMDDVSPRIVNYMLDVQKNLFTQPTASVSPKAVMSTLPTDFPTFPTNRLPCIEGDVFCVENFLKASFEEPIRDQNIFSYENKNFIKGSASLNLANSSLRFNEFSYETPKGLLQRSIDFENGNFSENANFSSRDFLAVTKGSTQGQVDAKIDVRSAMTDLKFDISGLKDLYACFTTFNSPATRSSAQLDEAFYGSADPASGNYYYENIRIPSCLELYCGTQMLPDTEECTVTKGDKRFGDNVDLLLGEKAQPLQESLLISTLTGFGPAVTMSLRTQEDITADLLKLSRDLILSGFNPKSSNPNAKYKEVNKISDIMACYDDFGKIKYLNDDGSFTYNTIKKEVRVYSPVPLMSFLSMPYFSTYLHSLGNDNYQNKTPMDPNKSFSESCQNGNLNTNPDQNFAHCSTAILPGGVYSISALNLIADMCTQNIKVDFSDSSRFDYVTHGSGVDNTRSPRDFDKRISASVNLAMTKIGTPTSLCLCDPYDLNNCSDQNKLNNYLTKLHDPFDNTFTKPSSFTTPGNPFVRNSAVGSFLGGADQWKVGGSTANLIGVLCDKSKIDSRKCIENIAGASPNDRNITGTPNEVSGDNKLEMKWPFSYKELDIIAQNPGPWNPDKLYLHYSTGPSASPMTTDLSPILSNNPLATVKVLKGPVNAPSSSTVESISDEILKRTCTKWKYVGKECEATHPPRHPRAGSCISYKDLPESGQEEFCALNEINIAGTRIEKCVPAKYPLPNDNNLNHECVEWVNFEFKAEEQNVSDIGRDRFLYDTIVADDGRFRAALTNTPLIPILTESVYKNPSEYNEASRESSYEGNLKLVQQSEDGTRGYVRTTYEYFNEKYDPLPSLLNKFRNYSIWGIIPAGGEHYCRVPKISALANFETYEMVDNSAEKGLNVNFNDSRGVSCNALIPDEMSRCNNEDITQGDEDMATLGKPGYRAKIGGADNTPSLSCQFRKCLSLCSQMYTTYYLYAEPYPDGQNPQFYCANKFPKTTNVPMELNPGDEACVLDYAAKIKGGYRVPSASNFEVPSIVVQKNQYPVYNNQLCFNPKINVDLSYLNDPVTSGKASDSRNCPLFVDDRYKEGPATQIGIN